MRSARSARTAFAVVTTVVLGLALALGRFAAAQPSDAQPTAAPPAAAQTVKIPRTTITLDAPPGFKVSRTFGGLENADTGSKITLVESPAAGREELVAAFSSPKSLSSRYASQGIRFTRIEPLTVADGQIPLAIGGQAENGKEVVKYLTTLGGEPETNTMAVLVTVSITPLDTLTRTDVEKLLRSIKLARVPTLEEKAARLTFKFDVVAPFKMTVVQESSATLVSTEKGDTAAATPAVVINRALTSRPPGEIAQLSETLMHSIAGFKDAQPSKQGVEAFAGGQGYLVEATAGTLSLLQLVRVLPGGKYIRLVARGETEAFGASRDQILQIAQSVTLAD